MNEDQTDEYIKNLINANNLISEDILNNDTFDVEDLELVRDRIDSLMEQLKKWINQYNYKRVFYDLKNNIQWMLDNNS